MKWCLVGTGAAAGARQCSSEPHYPCVRSPFPAKASLPSTHPCTLGRVIFLGHCLQHSSASTPVCAGELTLAPARCPLVKHLDTRRRGDRGLCLPATDRPCLLRLSFSHPLLLPSVSSPIAGCPNSVHLPFYLHSQRDAQANPLIILLPLGEASGI